MSLDLADIREVKGLAPDAKVGYFVSVEMGDFLSLQIDWLAPRHTLVSRKVVLESRARGIPVLAWTVDDPMRIVELLELGVDGIITNEPTRTRQVVDSYFRIPVSLRSLLRFRRLWGALAERPEFQMLIDYSNEDAMP
jgi:glycerophosphoryl diester phosphodiesterase